MKIEKKKNKNYNNIKKLFLSNNISTNDLEMKKSLLNDFKKQIKLEEGINSDLNNKNIFPILKTNILGEKKQIKNKNNKFKSRNNLNINEIIKTQLLSNDKNFYSSFDSFDNTNNLYYNNISSPTNSKTINYDYNNTNTKILSEQNSLSSIPSIPVKNNKKILKRNKENNKSSIYIFNTKNTFITNSPKLSSSISKTFKEINQDENSTFNLHKKIKNIKKNKSFHNNKELLYVKKYKYAVLDPINILKLFNLRKQAKLYEEEKSLNKFLNANREISKKNLILKIINTELNNLINKEKSNKNILLDIKNKLKKNKNNFDEYKDDQKKLCRKIEKILINKQKENRALIEKEYNINYDMHVIKEYFRKFLAKIDEYRYYGKFINEAMGGDTTRFDHEIYPIKSDKELNFDYELLTKQTINNYRCFLNENNEFENDEKFIKENKFIKDPVKMVDKFIDLQNYIILHIKDEEKIIDEINKMRKENYLELKYLKFKCNALTNEYNSLQENYNEEINKINLIKKEISKGKNKHYYIIKDFYYFISNIDSRKKNINISEKSNIFEYLQNINKNIFEMQSLVNDLLFDLNNYEEEDKKVFKEAVIKRKDEIKMFKRNLALQKFYKNNQKSEYIEIEKKKINFIVRKTEAPFKKPKKPKKILILNEKQIENLENNQLLNYEIE